MPRWIVRTAWVLFIVVAAALLTLPRWAAAAPRAENAQECSIAADMAVVARALAEERYNQAAAEPLMRRIYKVDTSPRGQEMLRAIIKAAYVQNESAAAWATKVHLTCMTMGGNLDSVLGVSL